MLSFNQILYLGVSVLPYFIFSQIFLFSIILKLVIVVRVLHQRLLKVTKLILLKFLCDFEPCLTSFHTYHTIHRIYGCSLLLWPIQRWSIRTVCLLSTFLCISLILTAVIGITLRTWSKIQEYSTWILIFIVKF